MKKLLCFITCLFVSLCYADSWEASWKNGIQYYDEENYSAAENAFNVAIANLKKNHDHFSVYIDRAMLYNRLGKFDEALTDVNTALSSSLTNEERIRGLVTRITTCCKLKMETEMLADYEEFKAINPDFPKWELTKDKIIIHHVPNCSCYKNLAKAILVASEICEKETDIQMLDNGVCIGKRRGFTHKMVSSRRHCSECVDDCKFWCNKCALVGIEWCVNVFKTYKCQKSCLCAVDLIKENCNWCCRKGHSDKKCVKPFENILFHMDRSCDPHCHDD